MYVPDSRHGIRLLLALRRSHVAYLEQESCVCVCAGIYFTFVMMICAISVSVTMLVLSVYHHAPSHAAAVITPVPHWVRPALIQPSSSSLYNCVYWI